MALRVAPRLVLCLAGVLFIACSSSAAQPSRQERALVDARGCAASDRHPVVSSDLSTRKTLVPAGATVLTLCRYRGLNPSPKRVGTLLRSRRITNATKIEQLTSALNALPRGPSGPGVTACPADDGSEIVARFAYPHAPVDPVVVELTGCEGVGNGHIERWAAPDPALIQELRQLTS